MSKFINRMVAFVLSLPVVLIATAAWASDEAVASSGSAGALAIAIALGIGVAAAGGALGQGRAASAALEGISRNPEAAGNIFVPLILSLAFMESLVLFTWVLMYMLLGKI